MTLKKSLMSALLASLTLVSVVACNAPTSQEVLPNTTLEQTENVNAMSVDQIKAKFKLNYNTDNKKTAVVKVGTLTNPLSRKVVDLRPNFQEVYNQGNLGACTAFSMVKGLREYLLKKSGKFVKLSALEFYYKEREIMGTVSSDSGAQMDIGMNVLKNHGAALNSDWPYDVAKFAIEPDAETQAKAWQYKLTSITQLSTLSQIKEALDAGKPVAFGTKVPTSFMKPSESGIIPEPAPNEQIQGGHAVLAVGYDDEKKAIIMRNSWSTYWGANGYAYLPYSYWSKGYIVDAWTGEASSK